MNDEGVAANTKGKGLVGGWGVVGNRHHVKSPSDELTTGNDGFESRHYGAWDVGLGEGLGIEKCGCVHPTVMPRRLGGELRGEEVKHGG